MSKPRTTADAAYGNSATSLAESSDQQLIELSKDGNSSAFAELWTRHAAAGRTVARSFSSSLDPDDLVAEAFTRIYQLLQKGRGPTAAFRPYLFTTIRNTASSWGRARRETSIDTLETFEDPASSEDASMLALDRGLTATAFRSLPTRWQEVLWYSEVESMTPAQIAPLLGMTANGVAALSYRAREGLRQAWIGVHLNTLSEDTECRWTIDHLGVYARGSLGQRDTTRLEKHLDECAMCTIAASEAKEVGSRLALVLLPLTAGVGGAAAYSYWLQTGGPASQLAAGVGPMPATITASALGAPAGAAQTPSSSTGTSATAITVASVIGGLAIAASVVAATIFGPGLFASGRQRPAAEVLAEPAPVPLPDAAEAADPAPLVPVPSDVDVAPPAPAVPDASAESEADRALAPANPVPAPTNDAPAPSPQPTTQPVVDLAAPVITGIDTAGDRYFPVVAGTAKPGATVQISISGSAVARSLSSSSYAVVADATGRWSALLSTDAAGNALAPGQYSVSATQHLADTTSKPNEAMPFTLTSPTISSPSAGATYPENALPVVVFAGVPGSSLQFSQNDGVDWAIVQLDSSGAAQLPLAPGLIPGIAQLSTRYASSDGRMGSLSTTQFTVAPAVPQPPVAPSFSIDTAGGLYFPIVAGTGAVADAAITVWIDGVMVATADADAQGSWSTNAIAQLSAGTHNVAATQTANGLTSAASADQSFVLLTPTIVSPTVDSIIPLQSNVTLQLSGVAGASLRAFFSTTKDNDAPIVTRRDLTLDGAGNASDVFSYTLRQYWQRGSMTVFYSDGTRVGPSTILDIVRKLS